MFLAANIVFFFFLFWSIVDQLWRMGIVRGEREVSGERSVVNVEFVNGTREFAVGNLGIFVRGCLFIDFGSRR